MFNQNTLCFIVIQTDGLSEKQNQIGNKALIISIAALYKDMAFCALMPVLTI